MLYLPSRATGIVTTPVLMMPIVARSPRRIFNFIAIAFLLFLL